ncbi:hypothetical protein SAMN05421770_10610 [Granulicella rosea]|uniref:Uncharacterized protein n=1 Tax=Granulicella rosea TaxID=474952 RepID=A0A239L267_9BACT|nr:hypothetical protein [Granulicella rosea]SNT23829.1 hypothetical protein SAMN05421770_10610 [Granulicella rosea]
MKPAILLLPTLLLSALTGCTNVSAGAASGGFMSMSPAQLNEVRQEMDHIPPPSKTRYLAVKSLTSWENPYLTIQGRMVTLHVTLADANTSDLGQGGLLRPVGARRQDLNVRTSDLAAAMNAIPQTAWPYGRVVAIEEAHDIPPSARPEVRRNMETAIKNLSDIGVVVYEWQEGGAGLK